MYTIVGPSVEKCKEAEVDLLDRFELNKKRARPSREEDEDDDDANDDDDDGESSSWKGGGQKGGGQKGNIGAHMLFLG